MKMDIQIQKINEKNLSDAGKCDGAFEVTSKLRLDAEDGVIRYTIDDVHHYIKRYSRNEIDYATYTDNPERIIYLATVDSLVVGQIVLRKNWNRYAYIEDIAVDADFRRLGIGRQLIETAIQWAKDHGLAGLMLETQNNNVAACKLYERCGFILGGFDTYLYRGIDPETEEIALFWYLMF
jgi:ribosomal protein S18 acetylase RimI-like enzyme